MENSKSRRNFLKTLLAAPAMTWTGVIPGNSNSGNISEQKESKLKISLNLYSFNDLLRNGKVDLFDMINFCVAHNFDAIDPTGYYFPGYPEVPSDEFIYQFKRKVFIEGLEISGTGVKNDFTNPDKNQREADLELVKKWIEVAAKLGSPNLRIFAGNNMHEGFSRDQVFEWMAKDIRECCDYGKKHGVMIALQNHNGFLKTADDVDRVFEMVGSDWLGQNLDIGSYRMIDPYQEVYQNIGHAITWQIKENVWIEGKETPTDFEKLFWILKKEGYRGYIPLETLGEGDPFEKVPRMLEQVRKALKKID